MFRVDRSEPGERARVGVGGVLRGGRVGETPGERHDEVATRDERLLVGCRDDLAGAQGGEHRPEADDAAGRDDDEVDVVTGRERLERIRPADAFRAGRQVQAARPGVVGQCDRRRPEARGLFGEQRPIRTRRERGHDEGVRVRGEDLDRLAPDRSGRAEEGDALRSALPYRPRVSG